MCVCVCVCVWDKRKGDIIEMATVYCLNRLVAKCSSK